MDTTQETLLKALVKEAAPETKAVVVTVDETLDKEVLSVIQLSPTSYEITIARKSVALENWNYFADSQLMAVTYTGGRKYFYEVPVDVYDAFVAADSLGAFLNKEIKPNYPCFSQK